MSGAVRKLRRLQYRAQLGIDAIYGPVARQAETIVLRHAVADADSDRPRLTALGIAETLWELRDLVDGAQREASLLIATNVRQAAALGDADG